VKSREEKKKYTGGMGKRKRGKGRTAMGTEMVV